MRAPNDGASTETLLATIDELRACLFFEQRRWHHFGYGFDDEAFAYVGALVATQRERLNGSDKGPASLI